MKRSKKATPINFNEREQLPSLIPAYWDKAIMNRTFKMRVIHLVINRLPLLLDLGPGEQLIIDYMGAPQIYTAGEERPSPMPDMEAIGEADLKFFRYAEMFGSLLVMATDSDYLPISLLRLHTQFEGKEQPRVILQRLRVTLASDKAPAKGHEKKDKEKSNEQRKRHTEFVDVNLLLSVLLDVFRQVGPSGVHSHSHSAYFIEMLCGLIAMFGGTDFTRGMPQVGPKRIWDSLTHVFPAMIRCFDPDRRQLREAATVDDLVVQVYAKVFSAHVAGAAAGGAASLLSALQRSKLSPTTKMRMPSMEFIHTTICNSNWVLLYWSGLRVDELSGDYGYKPCGNRLTYADL